MEQPNVEDGDYQRAAIPFEITNAAALEGRSNQSPRLQKRRSNAGMRRESHAQPLTSPGPGMAITRDGSTAGGSGSGSGGGFGDGAKARKGSIRNGLRKIFGRRSRDVGSLDTAPTTSRHAYHKSEPAALSPPQELPELSAYPDEEPAHPSFSDSYPVPSPSFNRTASPYAVQFPNSVKLKPMDLGNPFMNRPAQTQLKRRKTLPSLVVAEREAAAIAARVAERESFETKPGQERRYAPMRGTSKKDRRKSRSTDDLKNVVAGAGTPPRKRSEEIRYWRESFQPDVLRASGFRTRSPQETETVTEQVSNFQQSEPLHEAVERPEESRHPPLVNMDNFSLPSTAVSRSDTFRSSPPVRHGRGKSGSTSLGESDIIPSSAVGTEMSRDLEDRVAKLEAGLQNFQRSLQRLTADRNRRTVIMGSVTTRKSSTDMRTPSLLADTLADPLDPASYEYAYEQTALRPSTSPQQAQHPQQPQSEPQAQPPPRQIVRRSQAPMEDPFGPEPATAAPLKLTVPSERPANSFKMPPPLSSHPPTQQPPVPSSSSIARNQPQPYTFSSLYQMLADERSARRKLESQLKGLRQEITDLHSQVAFSSNVQSTRSSYKLAGSSSKLQELLRETESSPPGTATQSPQRDSGMGGPRQLDPIVSRFSASESEAGAQEHDDLETPYENYRTPREERSAYSLASQVDSAEGEMF